MDYLFSIFDHFHDADMKKFTGIHHQNIGIFSFKKILHEDEASSCFSITKSSKWCFFITSIFVLPLMIQNPYYFSFSSCSSWIGCWVRGMLLCCAGLSWKPLLISMETRWIIESSSLQIWFFLYLCANSFLEMSHKVSLNKSLEDRSSYIQILFWG